jgi:hypothetical protein
VRGLRKFARCLNSTVLENLRWTLQEDDGSSSRAVEEISCRWPQLGPNLISCSLSNPVWRPPITRLITCPGTTSSRKLHEEFQTVSKLWVQGALLEAGSILRHMWSVVCCVLFLSDVRSSAGLSEGRDGIFVGSSSTTSLQRNILATILSFGRSLALPFSPSPVLRLE